MRSDILRVVSVTSLVAAIAAPLAWSSFQAPVVPSFRGQPCTEYSGFETFTVPFGGTNGPDDPSSTSPDTRLEQLVAGAVITAAGNIDHLSLAPIYRLTDSVPGDLQEVALQVSIHLNQFPWPNVVLRYTDANQVVQSVAPTTSLHLVFQMGHEERLLTWDLSAIADTILSYSIEMPAAFASTTLDAIQLDTRFTCSPGLTFCSGDGLGGGCPCGNLGAPGAGCENSLGTGGGVLWASGSAVLGSDTVVLHVSGLPTTTSVLFFQGTSPTAAVFGDGLRCVGGTIVRLGTKTTSAGTADFGHGIGADPDVSVRGMIPVGGGLYRYQGWYRNAAAFCTSATFNLTNGISIVW